MTQAPGNLSDSRSTSPLPATPPGGFIADPAPLGLAAFALTTFVLSMTNTGLFHVEPVVFGLAFAYGGIAQFAAGMWEFAKGNTFGATAFASYGAFWVSFWWLAEKAWGFFTAYMTVAATRVSGAVLVVFALLTVTFVVLAIGNFGPTENIIKVGGWIGVATALAAWYASFAGVTAFTFKRPVVPTGPRE